MTDQDKRDQMQARVTEGLNSGTGNRTMEELRVEALRRLLQNSQNQEDRDEIMNRLREAIQAPRFSYEIAGTCMEFSCGPIAGEYTVNRPWLWFTRPEDRTVEIQPTSNLKDIEVLVLLELVKLSEKDREDGILMAPKHQVSDAVLSELKKYGRK